MKFNLTSTFPNLTKRLDPTGRAFRIPNDSTFEKVHKALIKSEEEAYMAAIGILDTILPDNDNFTEEDASNWERRLAIRSSNATSLVDRKLAIARKYATPGDIPARQHYLYLQGQLREVGFDVYVHENIPVQNPTDFIPSTGGLQLGQFQLGQGGLGGSEINLVANFIDESKDSQFSLGSDFRATFFIGGQVKGDTADVPEERKDEFRQLILNVKPLHTIAVLLINYV